MATKKRAGGKAQGETPAPAVAVEDASLHLVFGGDEYLVSVNARKIVEKLCPAADQAFGLEVIDARVDTVAESIACIGKCMDAMQTLGFLGGRKVVWLKDALFFGTGLPCESKDVKAAAESLVNLIKAGFAPGQILVISALRMDRRSAFFKACQASGRLVEYDVPEKSHQLEQHAQDMASAAFRKAGLSCSGEVAAEFLGKTGTDTRQIVQEAEKLAVYLGERKEVRVEDVRDIVCAAREAAAWDLTDAVGHRDVRQALGVLRQLLFQGENHVAIIAGLETRFRELLFFRECIDRRWIRVTGSEPWLKVEWNKDPEIDAVCSSMARDPRQVNVWRAGKLVEQARKFSARELMRCQAVTLAAHETLFSSGLPKNLLLEFLVLRLLGPGRDRKGAGVASRPMDSNRNASL